MINRRAFLKRAGLGAAALAVGAISSKIPDVEKVAYIGVDPSGKDRTTFVTCQKINGHWWIDEPCFSPEKLNIGDAKCNMRNIGKIRRDCEKIQRDIQIEPIRIICSEDTAITLEKAMAVRLGYEYRALTTRHL